VTAELLDSNEFLSKSRRARYDITPKIGFLGIKGEIKKDARRRSVINDGSSVNIPLLWEGFDTTAR
jgi:hypothetical protein